MNVEHQPVKRPRKPQVDAIFVASSSADHAFSPVLAMTTLSDRQRDAIGGLVKMICDARRAEAGNPSKACA
jgi:hypothetical protein